MYQENSEANNRDILVSDVIGGYSPSLVDRFLGAF
jgi:hypothetical protein